MLSKSAIKYINSLKLKKFRQRYGKFTAEGDKIVKEILQHTFIAPDYIYCTNPVFLKSCLIHLRYKQFPFLDHQFVQQLLFQNGRLL